MGDIYNLSVRIQYKDENGNLIRFSQTNPLDIDIKSKEEAVDEPLFYAGTGNVIMGLFILAAVSIFSFILYKAITKTWGSKKAVVAGQKNNNWVEERVTQEEIAAESTTVPEAFPPRPPGGATDAFGADSQSTPSSTSGGPGRGPKRRPPMGHNSSF